MPDELFAVDGKHVGAIAVDLGEVWISFDGKDRLVSGGHSIAVDTLDRIVIQTVSPGRADIRIDFRADGSESEHDPIDKALPQLRL